MPRYIHIFITLLLVVSLPSAYGQGKDQRICFEFFEGTFNGEIDTVLLVNVPEVLTPKVVKEFYAKLNTGNYKPIVDSLINFKKRHHLNDWLYYQLIRKAVQQVSPKADNYSRYTLYKWFLLAKSGYDARLALATDKVIFYVFNNEDIEDIPLFTIDNKKYVCLNKHDYADADLNQDPPLPVTVNIPEAINAFSYRIDKMPDFKPEEYFDKELQFTYRHKIYYFNVKLNNSIGAIFANYPVVDFESYFNIPLSKETYGSLIPQLRKYIQGMDQKKGVDYLMRFTRNAFLYENDEDNFGKEKRLAPEETLFEKYSDCDDRAALFFYLVREIYNLPMITLLYPTHVTVAIQFDKPIGKPIVYKGNTYSICEPTPQAEDLKIGQIAAKLRNVPYEVVYQYMPANK